LADAAAGRVDLVATIGAYESAMAVYSFRTVEQSLRVSNAVASTNILERLAFRGVLRLAARIPLLKDLLLRRPTLPAV
jgi:hypothetical protein